MYPTCVCVCVVCSRHRGEVLDVGAHQEGAGAAPPQPQEEENHLQLYYWFVSLAHISVLAAKIWSVWVQFQSERDWLEISKGTAAAVMYRAVVLLELGASALL